MDNRYDFTAVRAQLRANANSGWKVEVPIDWAVLAAFEQDLDRQLIDTARGAGLEAWSEDRGTDRVYHFRGNFRGGAGVIEQLLGQIHTALNQPKTDLLWFVGHPNTIASIEFELMQADADPRLSATGKPIDLRDGTHRINIQVSGPLGMVREMTSSLDRRARHALRIEPPDSMTPRNRPVPEPAVARVI